MLSVFSVSSRFWTWRHIHKLFNIFMHWFYKCQVLCDFALTVQKLLLKTKCIIKTWLGHLNLNLCLGLYDPKEDARRVYFFYFFSCRDECRSRFLCFIFLSNLLIFSMTFSFLCSLLSKGDELKLLPLTLPHMQTV